MGNRGLRFERNPRTNLQGDNYLQRSYLHFFLNRLIDNISSTFARQDNEKCSINDKLL